MKETMIFDQKQPQIVYGTLGDTYIFANEREVEVEEVFSITTTPKVIPPSWKCSKSFILFC